MPTVPFRSQSEFDQIIGEYSFILVRGEDSLSQAVAAGVPILWHIYPQKDQAHFLKLDAFLKWYLDQAPAHVARAVTALHHAWITEKDPSAALKDTLDILPDLQAHARTKAHAARTVGDAAQNLVDFVRAIG